MSDEELDLVPTEDLLQALARRFCGGVFVAERMRNGKLQSATWCWPDTVAQARKLCLIGIVQSQSDGEGNQPFEN